MLLVKRCLGSGLCRSEGALLAFCTILARCHSNPSLGIIQAVASDTRRKRVEDRAKKAAAVFWGEETAWGTLKRQHERRRKRRRKEGTKTKGHSSEYSGIEVN